MDAVAEKPNQFSMRRLFVVTSIVAAIVAVGMAAGAAPVEGIVLAALGIGLATFILFTVPQTWLLTFGTFFGFVIVVGLGSLLYRSPIPALVAGLACAVMLFVWVKRSPMEQRLRKMTLGLLASTTIVALPYLARWRHHRAEYVIWKSGVQLRHDPVSVRGQSYEWLQALGPYLTPFESSLRFGDDPVRWGGIKFDDQQLVALSPHFKALRGSYYLGVWNANNPSDPNWPRAPNITDEGFAALAKIPKLRTIEIVSEALTNEGVRKFQQWDSVEFLILRCSKLDDAIVDWVVKFRSLEHLDLSETQLTEEGLTGLIGGLNITDARFEIVVPKTIAQETMQELQAKLPKKTVIHYPLGQ